MADRMYVRTGPPMGPSIYRLEDSEPLTGCGQKRPDQPFRVAGGKLKFEIERLEKTVEELYGRLEDFLAPAPQEESGNLQMEGGSKETQALIEMTSAIARSVERLKLILRALEV